MGPTLVKQNITGLPSVVIIAKTGGLVSAEPRGDSLGRVDGCFQTSQVSNMKFDAQHLAGLNFRLEKVLAKPMTQ